jgi:tetratricopeptide (TPR) repeat protein
MSRRSDLKRRQAYDAANAARIEADRLRTVGQPSEALATVDEALSTFRRQVEDDVSATPGLALAVMVRGDCLHDLGRDAEAWAALDESVRHHRWLVERAPFKYQHDLASSLDKRSVVESALGRDADVIASTQEVVVLLRQLMARHPDLYRGRMLLSLRSLAAGLRAADRIPEAVDVMQESAALERGLPTRASDLAETLTRLALLLRGLDRREEALGAAEEAAAIRGGLLEAGAEQSPRRAVRILHVHLALLSDFERRNEAAVRALEILDLRREIASAEPDEGVPELADWLRRVASMHLQLGRRHEALAASSEAVDLYRTLADADRPASVAVLARALSERAWSVNRLGHCQDGMATSGEAVTLARSISTLDADPFCLPDLLAVHAAHLASVGRVDEAQASADQALILFDGADAASAELRAKRRVALVNLSASLGLLGRPDEALATIEEALVLARNIPGTGPAPDQLTLARTLDNHACRLHGARRFAEVFDSVDEGEDLARRWVDRRPAVALPLLADLFAARALGLHRLGRDEEAASASEKSVALTRQLDISCPGEFDRELTIAFDRHAECLQALGRPDDARRLADEAATIRQRSRIEPQISHADLSWS